MLKRRKSQDIGPILSNFHFLFVFCLFFSFFCVFWFLAFISFGVTMSFFYLLSAAVKVFKLTIGLLYNSSSSSSNNNNKTAQTYRSDTSMGRSPKMRFSGFFIFVPAEFCQTSLGPDLKKSQEKS